MRGSKRRGRAALATLASIALIMLLPAAALAAKGVVKGISIGQQGSTTTAVTLFCLPVDVPDGTQAWSVTVPLGRDTITLSFTPGGSCGAGGGQGGPTGGSTGTATGTSPAPTTTSG